MFEFVYPERFVAGTVGLPGQRTFYLQTTGFAQNPAGRNVHESVVSVAVEKRTVSRLAAWCKAEIAGLVGSGALSSMPEPLSDRRALSTPVEEDFRAADVRARVDRAAPALTLELFKLEATPLPFGIAPVDSADLESAIAPGAAEDRDEPKPGLKVKLSPPQAFGFALRAEAVVAAGRPPCPFCQGPLDLDGHICPRANGYKR